MVDRSDRVNARGEHYWSKGLDSELFDSVENRDKAIQMGLEAIAAEGGWPQYADQFTNMTDWEVAIDFKGESFRVMLMFPGLLGIPGQLAENSSLTFIDEFSEVAKAELRRFGFKVSDFEFIEPEQEKSKPLPRIIAWGIKAVTTLLYKLGLIR